jgi:integrase
MGRKRKAEIMLPKHVHKVKWASGTFAYYFQKHRSTPKAGPRTRLPDNPTSEAFWKAVRECQEGPKPAGNLSKMIDAYLEAPHFKSLAENTRREYERYMIFLRNFAVSESLDTDDLNISDVAFFRDEFGKKTPAKANAFVRAVAAVYAWGCERGFANSNPGNGVSKLKIGTHKPWTLEIWDLAINHFRPELVTACYLGRFTGQRLGDCLRMRFADIKQDSDGTEGIEVTQQKTGTQLFIPLLKSLMPAIAASRRPGREFIVSRDDNSGYTVDQFHARWGFDIKKNPELKPLKDGGFSFHGLRK